MAYAYKLVSQDMTTYNDTQWKLMEAKEIDKNIKGNKLCSTDVFHCYESPELAVFMNPSHAGFATPRLFKARCTKIVTDDKTKQGTKKMTLIKELKLPIITNEQRIHIAIVCALLVYKEPNFIVWAEGWLTKKDRSTRTAMAAEANANATSYAATSAATSAANARAANARAAEAYAMAANATKAATYAAKAATYAATSAANATRAAARAAEAAANATKAAARAAEAAALDLSSIIRNVLANYS